MLPRLLQRCAAGLAVAGALLATASAVDAPRPLTVPPLPAVLDHAKAGSIPIECIYVSPTADEGRIGDALTVLISAHESAKVRQWLVRFTLAAATPEERAAAKPMTATITVNEQKHVFTAGDPVALDVQTAGPFSAQAKPPGEPKRSRVLVSPKLLGLGLDRASEMMIRTPAPTPAEAGTSPPATTTPPTTLSFEDGQLFAGLFPSMMSFFQAVDSTPGLREILWSVLEKPSLWSIARRGGKIDAGFNFGKASTASGADWGVPDMPCYRMELTLSLNGQPALECAFYVTSPRPPLLATAGIVGIVADSPKDKAKRVLIRVLSGQRVKDAAPALASAVPASK
ncbi:MAG: hypothetical protein V4773_13110 [Verrucomicrobiota bacterium]